MENGQERKHTLAHRCSAKVAAAQLVHTLKAPTSNPYDPIILSFIVYLPFLKLMKAERTLLIEPCNGKS